MPDPVTGEPTDEDLDERFILEGDPEDALRRLLNVPFDDEDDDVEDVPGEGQRSG